MFSQTETHTHEHYKKHPFTSLKKYLHSFSHMDLMEQVLEGLS